MVRRREEESSSDDFEHEKVMRELEIMKRELSRLKLDMDSVLEEKKRADKEREGSLSTVQHYMSKVEVLDKEIEEINEESVLVDLARMEAINEYKQVEVQRRGEADKYTKVTKQATKKKENIIQEIGDARDLKNKLAVAMSDIDVLATELKQVKEMEKRAEENDTLRSGVKPNFHEQDKSGPESLLESVMKELDDARKKLATLTDESYQFMTSMDIIRDERKHVEEEITILRNRENKSETKIRKLNSKLLRANKKLEATSAAKEEARSIASNLSLTLEELKADVGTLKNEVSQVSEETAVVKAEIQREETERDMAEETLQVVLQELKVAKLSEATALENLKAFVEKTTTKRVSSSQREGIIISKFEYEYLAGEAVGAQEIADKKVAAAKAWIEAMQASEKEIQIKSDLLQRETRELKVKEEYDANKNKGPTSDTNISSAEDDNENWRHGMGTERMKPGIALHRKAMNRSVKMTPARRGKARISGFPVVRSTHRSAPFTVRRRKARIPNIVEFLSRKNKRRISYLYEKYKTKS